MRVVKSVVILTATLMIAAIDLQAGLSFQHERTFTVPGLSGHINQMRFADINSDGVPEVLVCDSGSAIFYSITGDSVIFTAFPDSMHKISAIELADVNRDSVMDVVAAFNVDYRTTVTICFSGVSGYTQQFRDTVSGGVIQSVRNVLPVAYDFDHDGYKELILSIFLDVYWELSQYETDGFTVLYRSFPDSKLGTVSMSFSDVTWLNLRTPGMTFVGSSSYRSIFRDWHNSTTQSILIDTSGTFKSLPMDATVDPCGYQWDVTHDSHALCGGELDLEAATPELLMIQLFEYRCLWDGEVTASYAVRTLKLFHFTPPATCQEVWSRDDTGNDYTNYVYHPDLPGYFFAFSGDTLILFRGTDGSIHSRLTDVPIGTRYWDYPYADGKPRLVVTNGVQVSFYQLDVATDVNDEPDRTLPTSFVLNQPYPNPFNAELHLSVTMPRSQELTVDIFNIAGELVTRLYQGAAKSGVNRYQWDASGVASGIYLIRAQSSGETRSVKAVLLK